MGGGLIQLVAYGAQDIYLTGQPQITFFKSVYRRYTNFAIESILETVTGNPGFGSKVTVTVNRNGDLLKKLWIQYSPKSLLGGISPSATVGANIGHALIDTVELEIGGQLIDRQYGKWLTIWNYLTESNPTGQQGYITTTCGSPNDNNNAVIQDGNTTSRYNTMAYTHRGNVGITSSSSAPDYAYVPLQFWFCKNPGLAIPLIALQYQEVKLNIKLGTLDNIVNTKTLTGNEFNNFGVYGDYIYLDTTERRQFAQNAHEYLIDQLQINPGTVDKNIILQFNHPVKEIIWSTVPKAVAGTNINPSNVVPGGASPSASLQSSNYKLTFNKTDRFIERDLTYFTTNQVWDCHTGYGSVLFPNSVAVYSFSLRPEEHQPSGTCNFSRLDLAQLVRTSTDAIDIYAVNYNILRIMSGMGGLAYSN